MDGVEVSVVLDAVGLEVAVVLVALSLMALGLERSMWASDPEAEPPVTAAAEGDPIVSIGKNMSTLASRLSESSANADPQREQLQQELNNLKIHLSSAEVPQQLWAQPHRLDGLADESEHLGVAGEC